MAICKMAEVEKSFGLKPPEHGLGINMGEKTTLSLKV